jgi:hypothetical protein
MTDTDVIDENPGLYVGTSSVKRMGLVFAAS